MVFNTDCGRNSRKLATVSDSIPFLWPDWQRWAPRRKTVRQHHQRREKLNASLDFLVSFVECTDPKQTWQQFKKKEKKRIRRRGLRNRQHERVQSELSFAVEWERALPLASSSSGRGGGWCLSPRLKWSCRIPHWKSGWNSGEMEQWGIITQPTVLLTSFLWTLTLTNMWLVDKQHLCIGILGTHFKRYRRQPSGVPALRDLLTVTSEPGWRTPDLHLPYQNGLSSSAPRELCDPLPWETLCPASPLPPDEHLCLCREAEMRFETRVPHLPGCQHLKISHFPLRQHLSL